MNIYKHYIRTDKDNNIIHAFSDAFEQPVEGDILVNDNGGRHYNLNVFYNYGVYRCQYISNSIVERSQEDLDELWTQYKKNNPQTTSIPERVDDLESSTSELNGRTEGMQGVDFFTLDNAHTTDQRTLGMQDVQDWSLQLIFQLQQQVSDLQAQLEQI